MRFWNRFALVWLCLAAAASARDIFVSSVAGDDRREGRIPAAVVPEAGPVRTISKALRLAQAGDRIVVENTGVPYRETLSLSGSRHGGNSVGPLVIEGGGATLDGSVPIPAELWEHVAGDVYAYQPARLGYQQLFIGGRRALGRPTRWSDVTRPRLEPLEWCFWRGRIYLRVHPRRTPSDYELSCCGLRTGITLYYVQDVLIRDLAVRGFQLDGIAVHDVVQATRLENVTARDNGNSGVSLRGASLVELERCTLEGNGVAQLRVDDFARVWLYDCQLIGDTARAIQRSGGQVMIDRDPQAPPSR
jgi:hypothetical protein